MISTLRFLLMKSFCMSSVHYCFIIILDCDRCIAFKPVTIEDGGNDRPTTPSFQRSATTRHTLAPTTQTTESPLEAAAQSCPDLSYCPSMNDCTTRTGRC